MCVLSWHFGLVTRKGLAVVLGGMTSMAEHEKGVTFFTKPERKHELEIYRLSSILYYTTAHGYYNKQP